MTPEDLEKTALIERLVRLSATDIPGTPRLLMRERSPEELMALQHGVERFMDLHYADPLKDRIRGAVERLPNWPAQGLGEWGKKKALELPGVLREPAYFAAEKLPNIPMRDVLRHAGNLVVDHPLEVAAGEASLIPGMVESLVAGKVALHKIIDKYLTPVIEKKSEAKPEFKLQGHLEHQGLGIAVENRKGSVRKGVDKDGKPWRTVMKHPYGYIKGTKGADGEEVDAYVGPLKDATHAFVVHQRKDDGKGYDEDKVMLGFPSKEEAVKGYLKHYNDPKFLGPVSEVPMERLKELVESGKTLKKISAAQSPEQTIRAAFVDELQKIAGSGLMNYLASHRGEHHGDMAGLALMAASSADKLKSQLQHPENDQQGSLMSGDTGRSGADLTGLALMTAPTLASMARGTGDRFTNAMNLAGLGTLAAPTLDKFQANWRARRAGVDPEKKMLMGHKAHALSELAGYGMLAAPVVRNARHAPLASTAMTLGGYGTLAAPAVEDLMERGHDEKTRTFRGPVRSATELAGLGLLAGGASVGSH